MTKSLSLYGRRVLFFWFAALAASPTLAFAATYRQVVVVDKPAGAPGRAADIAVDGMAQRQLAERFIAERISPVLLDLRGDTVRALLEPAATLLGKFTVISRQEMDATHVRVTCEADVDMAAVILRLVNGKVLTFGDAPPRVLFLAADGTSPAMVQSLRARITGTLGSAGITVLAGEATATGSLHVESRPTPDQIAILTRTTMETRADLIATISYSSSSISSDVGGFIIDATVQYTLVRPRDNAIVAEQVFTSRGSGASADLAQRTVMDEMGPEIARGMAGRIGEAIFADGTVVDPDARLANSVTVNVFARPNSAATNALMTVLRERQLSVSLGDSNLVSVQAISNRVGDASTLNRPPVDRIIVSGKITVTQLFDLFTTMHFGDKNSLQASVADYGDNYLGIEILDKDQPTIPPVKVRPVEPEVPQNLQTPAPAPPPPSNVAANPVPTPANPAPPVAISAIPKSQVSRPPLVFVKTAWARTTG